MRIALIIDRMDVSRGGREISTAQIASGLAQAGHDVDILCQRGTWQGQGVRVVPLGRRGIMRVHQTRNFVAAVRRQIADGQYDVVHATLPVPGANVYQPRGGTIPGQVAASSRRWGALGGLRRTIAEPLNLSRRWLAQLERQVVADPTVFCLAVSQMVAEEFREAYGRERNVRVVFNGVQVPDCDDETRADWRQETRFRLGVGPDDPVFLLVATNFRLKAVTETIAAFAKWHHSRIRQVTPQLVIVGRDVVEGYERMASLRDVGRHVLFVPPTQEIFRWYAAADAVVLLSWYDPCSRVVLEATRWEIPSLTTVYNGAAEILSNGAGLVVASPKDTGGIVAALEDLADPARRAERSEACRQVADSLSIDRHVRELLDVYQEAKRRA